MAAAVVKVQQAHRSHEHGHDRHRDRRRDEDRDRDRDRRDRDRARRERDQRRRRSDAKRSDENDEKKDPEVTEGNDLSELEVVKRIQEGSHMELALEEVEEFAKVLGLDKDGNVKLQDVKDVFMEKLEPPMPEDEADALLRPAMKHAGQDEETLIQNSCVQPADLHWALTHGHAARKFKKSRCQHEEDIPENNVKLLQDTVVKITNRHDAFMTLPITAFYMCVFVALVTTHLRIWARQTSEKALEEWVNGRDSRTNCENNVDNMEAFWEWFLGDEDGINGVINFARPGPTSSWDYYTLANQHVLVGDIKLSKVTYSGDEDEKWLLHTSCGEAALQQGSVTKDAASLAASCLMKGCGDLTCEAQNGAGDQAKWDDPDISRLLVSFVTYNERAQMFGLTQVNIAFFEWGSVYNKINSEVVSVQGYPSWGVIVTETLFVLVIMWMAYVEGKDMWHAARLGCGEFKDYWQFWNCVDWICIMLGISLITMWTACWAAMQAEGMRAILDEDGKLNVDVMGLEEASVETIMQEVSSLQLRFRWLHFIMAANTVSIVSKFFKAFTSNPRLKVVTDTFKEASTDFAHFFIIFFTLFLPFTIIGHVLFGNDLEEFSSIGSSFNTGLQVMLGDYEWYVGVMEERSLYGETAYMPSGIPVIIVFLWFASYMFLVFLVLLNVLLAIIIKHQTEVDSRLGKEAKAEVPTIWKQVADYVEFRKRTKSFKYSLEHVRRMLENDEDPAHGDDEDAEVTKESLLAAFKDMSEEQAAYQLEIMNNELGNRREKEENEKAAGGDGVTMGEFFEFKEKMSTKIDEISEICNQPLDKGFDSINRKLKDVLTICERLQRQQASLGKRVEELSGRGAKGGAKDERTVTMVTDSTDAPREDEQREERTATVRRQGSAVGDDDRAGAERDDRRGKRRDGGDEAVRRDHSDDHRAKRSAPDTGRGARQNRHREGDTKSSDTKG